LGLAKEKVKKRNRASKGSIGACWETLEVLGMAKKIVATKNYTGVEGGGGVEKTRPPGRTGVLS